MKTLKLKQPHPSELPLGLDYLSIDHEAKHFEAIDCFASIQLQRDAHMQHVLSEDAAMTLIRRHLGEP